MLVDRRIVSQYRADICSILPALSCPRRLRKPLLNLFATDQMDLSLNLLTSFGTDKEPEFTLKDTCMELEWSKRGVLRAAEVIERCQTRMKEMMMSDKTNG